MAALAHLTADIADLAGAGRTDAAEQIQHLRQEAQTLAERAEQAATGQTLATVFVQYGKSVAPDVARSVADTLRGEGYLVPGEDRMPNDSREVRYFYMEDRATATELAGQDGVGARRTRLCRPPGRGARLHRLGEGEAAHRDARAVAGPAGSQGGIRGVRAERTLRMGG